MPMLRFKFTDVAQLVEHALTAPQQRTDWDDKPVQPGVMLVGDEGVYMMSTGLPPLQSQTTGHNIVFYAEGCNPQKDHDWWDRKGDTFGGDDGVEYLEIADMFQIAKKRTPLPEWVEIIITKNTLDIRM